MDGDWAKGLLNLSQIPYSASTYTNAARNVKYLF